MRALFWLDASTLGALASNRSSAVFHRLQRKSENTGCFQSRARIRITSIGASASPEASIRFS